MRASIPARAGVPLIVPGPSRLHRLRGKPGLRKLYCANRLCRLSPCRRRFHTQGTVHQRDENRLLRLMESIIWDGIRDPWRQGVALLQ